MIFQKKKYAGLLLLVGLFTFIPKPLEAAVSNPPQNLRI